jgi:phosphatidylethanolamine/phosphatidyl-N-methylethanolamine N-methyltransferase
MYKFRRLKKISTIQILLANKENFYSKLYNEISCTAKNDSLTHRFLHSSLEKDLAGLYFEKVLEVGGNKGEHIPFINHGYNEYFCTDINIFQKTEILDKNLKIKFMFANVENLCFNDNTFDRVIVTCLFHHLKNPEMAAQELRRVTKNNGVISIALPHDPGLIYRLLRALTTLRIALKNDFYEAIQIIHAREHHNHYLALHKLLQIAFNLDDIGIKSYPINRLYYNLNAFSVYRIIVRK